MAVIDSAEPTTSAIASNFGVELNGTYRVISNGDWAKSNEVFLDEKTVVQTWTVTSSAGRQEQNDCRQRRVRREQAAGDRATDAPGESVVTRG